MSLFARYIYILLLALAAGLRGQRVQAAKKVELVPYCGGLFELCGYRDKKTKDEVIAQQFERASPFAKGLAAVRIKGRYGYIDQGGKLIIKPRFDLAGGFFLGLAEVLVEGQTGVINRKGEIVVPPQFARAIPFTKDTILVRKGNWKRTHYRGYEKLNNLRYSSVLTHKWGLYHIRKGWLKKPQFHLHVFNREGGLIWATKGGFYKGPYGLLRPDGSWQVPPQYSHVQGLRDGRAIVRKPDKSYVWRKLFNSKKRPKELSGAVDPSGRLVVPLRSWWLSYWENGFALVGQNGKHGLLDRQGNIIGGRLFDGAKRGWKGNVGKVLLDGKWIGLTREGKIIANPDDSKVLAACPSGVKKISLHGKIRIVGPDGQQTVPYLLDNMYSGDDDLECDKPTIIHIGNNMKTRTIEGKYGFIGIDGKLITDPPAFDDVIHFDGGFAGVKLDGKWGIIDTRGHFTLKPQFDRLNRDNIGFFILTKANKKIHISPTGEKMASPSPAIDRSAWLSCPGGAKFISHGGKWGLADDKGRVIVKPEYRAMHCFSNGVAWGALDDRRKWCPVGPDGKLRDRSLCVSVRYPYVISHHSPERFAKDPYESSVLWMHAFLDFGAGKRKTPPKMMGDGIRGQGAITATPL